MMRTLLSLMLIAAINLTSVSGGLQVDDGIKIKLVEESSTTVTVSYTNNDVDSLKAVIKAQNDVVLNGTINTLHKNGTVQITPADTGQLAFGSYLVIFSVSNGLQEVDTTTALLIYEQTLAGLSVNNPVATLVSEATVLSASLQRGSGAVVEWIVENSTEVTYSNCIGSIDTIETALSFSSAKVHQVTVLIVNSFGDKLSGNIDVYVWMPVQGFSITTPSSLVAVNEQTTYTVKLDNITRLPMGDIFYNVSFGDGQTKAETQILSDNSLTTTGFSFQHFFTKQGKYDITVYIYTSLSFQILNYTSNVWDPISLPTANEYVEIYTDKLFHLNYSSDTPFHYHVDYGDGSIKTSPADILHTNIPINASEWNQAYNNEGVYTIMVDAWNDFYHKTCNYTIKVQNPVPELELSPKEENPLLQFPATIRGMNITLQMKNAADLRPTNMTCVFCFDVNECSDIMNVDFRSEPLAVAFHAYSVIGVKNITAHCSNNVSSRVFQTRIEILPGIEGFEVTNGYKFYLKPGGTTTVNFLYLKGVGMSARVNIFSSSHKYISGTVNENYKNGSVTIDESKIGDLSFGTYKVSLEILSTSGEIDGIAIVLFYDQPISDFSILPDEKLLLQNTDTNLQISSNTGSNEEIEILIKDTESILILCQSLVPHYNTTYFYDKAINYTINAVSRNSVSGNTSGSHYVMVMKPVTGFDIEVTDELIDSYTFATIRISLDRESRLPMHNLILYLDFGDGSNSSIDFDSTVIQQSLSLAGYRLNHSYTKQGNFTVQGYIQSVLSTLALSTHVWVWDNLTFVSLVSAPSAKVDEVVEFYFVNVTKSGFEYKIDYGDGSSEQSDPVLLNSDYVHETFLHSYDSPDVYEVSVYIWNAWYSKRQTFSIIVQHPIMDFLLSPQPPVQYPIPDGEVIFTISMTNNHPDPTNVTCQFIFENSIVLKNDSVNITFIRPDIRTYYYTTNGTKNVEVFCSNIVSNVTLDTKIEIRSVELDDFNFIYQNVVPMNMTRGAVDVPVEVGFSIELFECVRFPPEVTFTWDFGDNTETINDTSHYITHEYQDREIYTFGITIKNKTHSAYKTYEIKIGAVDFAVSSFLGGVFITRFDFTMTGLSGQYVLHSGNGETHSITETDKSKTVHLYQIYDYGKFEPEIIAISENFTEYLYFDQLIIVDYNTSVMEIDMPSSVKMPEPGDVNVTAYLYSTTIPLPFMHCTYDMQDFINYTVVNITQNITVDSPIIFNFEYLTLGLHDVTVNCSNQYDKYLKRSVIEVTNKCFTIDGIFDRQYARPTSPMKAYTTENFDLINRMGVHCSNETIVFHWTVYSVDINGNRIHKMINDDNNGNKGSYRFTKGKFPEGLYEVFLNVSLTSTWIPERTYIQFVRADPKAFIEGGFERTIKHSKQFVILDALTSSYDVAFGFGHNENLTFKWSCERITANDSEVLSANYANKNYQPEPCDITEISRGFANLTFNDINGFGYIVTVNVTLDTVYALYTQLIMAINSNGPDVYIRCMRLNCDVKYAVGIKSIWDVVCMDCVGSASYLWSLQMWNESVWETVTNFNTITTTGVLKTSLDILENALESGKRYKIKIEVTDSKGVGSAKWEVMTNYRPYGGICKAANKSVVGRPPSSDQITQEDPVTGYAFSTRFAVYCFDWKDEGERPDQNETLDSKFDKPLMYEYLIKQTYKDYNIEKSTETTLYKGGESTATELRLPAGSDIELSVKIIDRFGDFAKLNWALNISVNDSLEPRDIGRAQSLFEIYDLSRNVTKSGGNNVAVLQMISSTASLYNNISLANQTNEETIESSDSSDESGEELKTLVQKKTQEFVDEMASIVPPNNSLTILPAVAQLVASTMREVISNKDALSQVASEGVTNTTYEVLENIKEMMKLNPVPMQELDAMIGGVKDSEDVISKNLNFIQLESVEDLNKTLTYETVKADIIESMYYGNIDPDSDALSPEKIEAEYQKRLQNRHLQLQRANSTEKTTMKLLKSLDTINDANSIKVASGQGSPLIQETDEVYFSIEKDTVESFINKSNIKRKDFTFDFGNDTFTNISDGNVQLQVSVLDKSPILHAGGASKIRGKIVRFKAKKFVDQNTEEEELELPLSMSIENEKIPTFKEYDKTSFEDETDNIMHFRTQVQDEQDAIIVYFKPKDITEENADLYNITVTATDQITSTVGEHQYIADVKPDTLTEYGYKVFIPEGTFKEGDVIISFMIKKANETETNSGGLSRRKRSTEYLSASNYTFTNVSVGIVTTGCKVFDEATQSWTSNGCTVLPTSTVNDTDCYCKAGYGSIFTSSFFKPNMIDFHSVWSKFDASNAAVYGTLIVLIVLYFGGLVYLRRKDKQDILRWIPVLLCDNRKSDEYFYMISVYTGIRPGAGTSSNINFILGGEDGDSGIRLMSDGSSAGMQSKTVKTFIMSSRKTLGGLTYLRIWHDNSGEGEEASWYLHKVVVEDLQTKDRFTFLCDQWLALDMDDGMIERLLPVQDKENAGFDSVFSQETRTNLTDNHLWLSIVVRPQRSLFTRVQRLSCLMSLLMLTMITNAMFFQSDDEKTVIADTVRIGSLRLSLRTAYISVIGVLVTVPPILLMTHLFKNSEVKRSVSKRQAVDDDDDTDKAKNEIEVTEEAKFPHWCVYVAWVTVVLSILVPAFFLLLYSMQWGKDKSEEWLTTFVLSFLESLLVVDPLKVLLIALIIAWVFKKPADDKKLSVDLDAIKHQSMSITEKEDVQFSTFRMEILSKAGPPVEDVLQHRRAERLKEKIAQRAFVDLVLLVLFSVIVFSISYINRDVRAFQLKSNIHEHLFVTKKYQFGFDKVNSEESFFNWTKETLVPFMHPTERYNKGPLDHFDKRYTSDMNNLRVGAVRLRQVRSENVTCNDDRITGERLCVPEYDPYNEEKGAFVNRGLLVPSAGAWSHTKSEEVWGISITGVYNSYDGGGYIQNLGSDKSTSTNIINQLMHEKWIDRQTRAVFAEFTLFNPNINIYSYSIYLAEFTETGGAFHWADTQSFKASTITDATGALSIIFYVVFLIIILVLTFKLFKKFRNEGFRRTITNFWNVLDVILCFLSYAGTVIWGFKFAYTKYAIKEYNEDKNAFINFQHVVVWEYMFTCVLGGLCFTSTLRILNALKYNRKLTEVAEVLQKGANPIIQFSLMFSVVFFDFVVFGYFLFGATVHEYRNLFISFGSLTNTLIGRNSLDSMIKASPAFAELYFFVYVFFVIFTLMTVFAAILNESISEVRSSTTPDTIGIVKIVKTAVKDILGLVGIRMKSSTQQQTANKYIVKNSRQNVDASNILGLIRETLDDFKAEGNAEENPTGDKDKKEDGVLSRRNNPSRLDCLSPDGTKGTEPSADMSLSPRPSTARNVTIVFPDGKEEFYDFYKGYI